MTKLKIIFLLLFASHAACANNFSAPTIRFSQAWFIDTQIDTPPPASQSGWRQVNLPVNWYNSHRSDAWPAWYRMDFVVDDVKETWGIYLPAVNTNAVVWLNGVRIGDGGRMRDPAARNWHRPLYFNVQQKDFQRGHNSLYIQFLPKHSGFGFLGNIHVGPDAILRQAFEQQSLIKQTFIGISTVLLFSFGAFISLLWFKRRKESMYGWFAAACFSWAFVALDMYVQHVPVQERLWDTLVFSSVGWIVITMIIFLHRFWDVHHERYERFLLWFGLIGTVVLYLVGDEYFYFVSSFIWDNLLIAFSLYMTWVIVKLCRRCPSHEAWTLVLATLVAISFGGHDNLVQMGILAVDRPHLMPFGGVLMLGVIIWMLVKRFVSALDEMENINRDLDMRVQIKTRQLQQNHMHIKEIERDKILAQERERIMRDMHDGTGGHLVAALAQVETGNVNKTVLSETLQHALDDIRLMIDSLDPIDEDIVAVLAMLRSRLDLRLHYSGISVEWKVVDIPPIPGFGPEKVLQLMHILHEAVTNIIKHAQADTIVFRTGISEESEEHENIFIEIEDNGNGFNDKQMEGRGIANMHYRATQISARLKFINSNHGVIVRISFPGDIRQSVKVF